MKSLLFLAFFLLFGLCAQAQIPVDFKFCTGTGELCVTPSDSTYELCLILTPGFCESKEYEIRWGDGNNDKITLTKETTVKHTYDLRDFSKNCFSGEAEYNLNIRNVSCSNDNKGYLLTFKKRPEAKPTIQAACEGTAVQIVNNSCPSYSYGVDFLWEFSDGQKSTQVTPSLSFTDPNQTYKVKLTATSASCGSDTKEVEFKLKKLPVADYKITGTAVINQDTVVCLSGGGIVTLDGSISKDATEYRWQISGGNYTYQNNTNNSSQTTSIKLTEVGEYTITFTASNECGNKRIVKRIKVIDLPTLTLTKQSDACEAISFKIDKPIDGAIYTLNGKTLDPGQSISLPLATAPYIVSASLSNACGTQVVADTFTVAAAQQVKILSLPKDTVLCVNSPSVTLRANITGGEWSKNGVETQNGQSVFVPKTAGNYLITYSNGAGKCLSIDSVRIKVDGIQVTANDGTICAGTPFVKLVGSPANGKWTTTDCTNCIKGDTLFSASLTQNQISVTYEVSNQSGCKATSTAQITIGQPKADFSLAGNCLDGAFKPVNNSSGASSYIWKVNGKQVATEENPQLTLSSGVQTITLISGTGNCADSISKQITIVAPPAPVSFTPSETLGCAPLKTTFALNGTPDPDAEYRWTFGNSESFTGTQPPAQTFENSDKENRTYTITLTAKNVCGEQSFTKDVVVRPLAKAEIGVDSTTLRCTPARLLFSNRSSGHDKNSSRWMFGDGITQQSASDTIFHIFMAKDSAMVYRVKLEISSACGLDTAGIDITVYPTTVKALYTISKSTVCPGETIQFTDATVPKPNQWLWRFGDGSISTMANPTKVYNKAESEFTVTLIAYTNCGYDSTQHIVKTTSPPAGTFDDLPIVCEGSAVQFINKSDTQLGFVWDFGDGSDLDSTSYSPSHIYPSSGSFTASLYAYRGTQSCKVLVKKSTVSVTSPAIAKFGFRGDSLFCSPGPVSMINLSENADSYRWYFSDGRVSDAESPSLPFNQGTYNVKLIASKGGVCLDSVERVAAFVVRQCQVEIPEAFTPNDDGIGDRYTLFGNGILEISSLRIRNRWGEIVFDVKNIPAGSQQPGESWDGKIGTKLAPADMYVYEAEVKYIDNKLSEKLRGNLYLVR